jgi:hypothetical protein
MLKARPRLKLKGKPVRRRRHQSAWITFDEEAADRECWVEDVSQSGAKITVNVAAEVGSRFGITLIPRVSKRPCEVVWRRGNTLGVRFLD